MIVFDCIFVNRFHLLEKSIDTIRLVLVLDRVSLEPAVNEIIIGANIAGIDISLALEWKWKSVFMSFYNLRTQFSKNRFKMF